MSLVAYAASSDEESETEQGDIPTSLQKTVMAHQQNGHISDEDDDFAPDGVGDVAALKQPSIFSLSLPKPKNTNVVNSFEEDIEQLTPSFEKLPMPMKIVTNIIEEEDDEFLHKTASTLIRGETKDKTLLPKGPVKITIPSLKDFGDVDKDLSIKGKNKVTPEIKTKGSGLLSILPKAKSEQNFAKTATSSSTGAKETNIKSLSISKAPAFIPDTVKHRRPAHNTESADGIKAASKRIQQNNRSLALVDCSNSDEDSDNDDPNEGGDFFALNVENKLPEVSTNEINAMVAKRAARMAEATTKFLESSAVMKDELAEQQEQNDEEMLQARKRYHAEQLNAEAMQALVGSSAKRRRKQQEEIQVMDISSDQVLPNRDEWLRTALASSTAYQPTGVLVDEEPVAGTRRKHQITYLAHKAKANEAELQAMWAANRSNRRATQSKYGF